MTLQVLAKQFGVSDVINHVREVLEHFGFERTEFYDVAARKIRKWALYLRLKKFVNAFFARVGENNSAARLHPLLKYFKKHEVNAFAIVPRIKQFGFKFDDAPDDSL